MVKSKIKTIVMVVAILLCLALAGGWIAQTLVVPFGEVVGIGY